MQVHGFVHVGDFLKMTIHHIKQALRQTIMPAPVKADILVGRNTILVRLVEQTRMDMVEDVTVGVSLI